MSNKSPFLRHSFHYQFCKYSTKFLSVLFFPFSVLTPISTDSQATCIDELEREIKELKQANKIIRKSAAFFAQTELGNLPNLTILKLLPYSPELNPIEQVWQYIKQHWLSNRCFDSYEAIVNTASVRLGVTLLNRWQQLSPSLRVIGQCSSYWVWY